MPRVGPSGMNQRLTCPHWRSLFIGLLLLVETGAFKLGGPRLPAQTTTAPTLALSLLPAAVAGARSAAAKMMSGEEIKMAIGLEVATHLDITVSPGAMTQPPPFLKDFSKPMSIPEEGVRAAVEVMNSGRLFRYCATDSQVSAAEAEFAQLVDQEYALGVNSCSSAIMLALMVVGVKAGDEVITNGFTFTALPSTIMRLHATPVLVEATGAWTMDLDDLEKKAAASSAKVLLLSHMRGKVCDMDRVVEICETHGLTLVEDCAHGCGVKYRGRQLGYHAAVSAYSTQSDKVINSGEGGFLTTNDDALMAKAIYLSGAYERRYDKHTPHPPAELCEEAMLQTPNLSCRMSVSGAVPHRERLRSPSLLSPTAALAFSFPRSAALQSRSLLPRDRHRVCPISSLAGAHGGRHAPAHPEPAGARRPLQRALRPGGGHPARAGGPHDRGAGAVAPGRGGGRPSQFLPARRHARAERPVS